MTDLEITRMCAETMEFRKCQSSEVKKPYAAFDGVGWIRYDPLHDDAQAMALVKKFHLLVDWSPTYETWAVRTAPIQGLVISKDLNRAICECVAKMQSRR